MHLIKQSQLCGATLLAAIALAGCGKSESPATGAPEASAPASAPSQNTLTRRAEDAKRRYVPLDLSPNSWELDAYQPVYELVRNIYWSGSAKNLEKLAEDFSPEYRHEKDSFKRADLLKSLTPQLEQAYAAAQGQKDFTIKSRQSVSISPYDAASGGFAVSFNYEAERQGEGLRKDDENGSGRWHFRYIGVPAQGALYKPRDEQEARAIEAALTSQRRNEKDSVSATAQYAGHVLGSLNDKGAADIALFGVDSITAIDRQTGKPLLTLPSSALGPIVIGCRTTREALKLPETKSETALMSNVNMSNPRFC